MESKQSPYEIIFAYIDEVLGVSEEDDIFAGFQNTRALLEKMPHQTQQLLRQFAQSEQFPYFISQVARYKSRNRQLNPKSPAFLSELFEQLAYLYLVDSAKQSKSLSQESTKKSSNLQRLSLIIAKDTLITSPDETKQIQQLFFKRFKDHPKTPDGFILKPGEQQTTVIGVTEYTASQQLDKRKLSQLQGFDRDALVEGYFSPNRGFWFWEVANILSARTPGISPNFVLSNYPMLVFYGTTQDYPVRITNAFTTHFKIPITAPALEDVTNALVTDVFSAMPQTDAVVWRNPQG